MVGWRRVFRDALKEPITYRRRLFVGLFLALFALQASWYFMTLAAWLVDPIFVLVFEGGWLSKWFLLTNQFHLYWLVSLPMKIASSLLFVYLYFFIKNHFPVKPKFVSRFYYMFILFWFSYITINDFVGWVGRILEVTT